MVFRSMTPWDLLSDLPRVPTGKKKRDTERRRLTRNRTASRRRYCALSGSERRALGLMLFTPTGGVPIPPPPVSEGGDDAWRGRQRWPAGERAFVPESQPGQASDCAFSHARPARRPAAHAAAS